MVAFVPLALLGIVYFGFGIFGLGLLSWAGSVAAFVAVHGIAWMIVWVIAGFSETKKS